jgi:hypothetical protein
MLFSGTTHGRFAAWEDFKLGVKHFAYIERLAMVGENSGRKSWLSFAGHLPLLRFAISSAAI